LASGRRHSQEQGRIRPIGSRRIRITDASVATFEEIGPVELEGISEPVTLLRARRPS
jgi:hypothetical protein